YEALVDLGVKWRGDALQMAASLAWCRHRCGESAEAVVDLRRILEEQERLQGAKHADTLESCWLLGHVQHSIVHNFDEVRRLYERVIEGGSEVHGELSMEVLNAKNGLARILSALGEVERGIQLQEECVQGMLVAHGRTSIDTLIQLGDLASMYFDDGRFDDAEKLFEQVLKDQVRVLGRDHVHTQVTLGNLGSIYRKQGRLALSRKMALKSWKSSSKTAGDNAMSTLTMGHNLALVDIDLGLLEEAESILTDGIERLSQLYPKHRLLGRALTNLGRCMLLTQRPKEARGELERALRVLREVLEPSADWIVEAQGLRAQCDGDQELGGSS
ncbi:MAG: tetratricopeptide (TPR) repeat protein, partial [Pseudohongiellaceae bacterium]